MKQVIKGKRYDTETAKYITETGSLDQGIGPSDFRYWSETLYLKRTGEFFLFGEGGPMSRYSEPYENNGSQSGYKIVPLTIDEAQEWSEKVMDADEYEKLFGPVEAGTDKHLKPLLVTEESYHEIEQLAKEKGVSVPQLINEAFAKN